MRFLNQYKGLKKEVYILFIGRIVTRFGSMVNAMLTLMLNQKLGYNAAQVSLFMIGVSVVTMLASIFGGKLADKYNKRNCILFFDTISILLYLLCAFIELSTLSVVLIVISAAAQWAEHPTYNALIADITPFEDRERAYALQYLGTNIGLMAAPTLAGFLFKNHLHLLFIICSVAIAVSTVLIAFSIKDVTPVVDETRLSERRRDGESLFKILFENKLLILFLVGFGLYGAAYDQFSYLVPLDLGRMFGENGAVLYGTLNSTNCITVVIFSPILLSLFKKMSSIKKVVLADSLLLVGFVIYLLFIQSVPAYFLSVVLFTFGEIMSAMGCSPFLAKLSPASHRARLNGASSVFSNLLRSLLTLVTGFLYDRNGYMLSWFFVLGTAVLALLLLLFSDHFDN